MKMLNCNQVLFRVVFTFVAVALLLVTGASNGSAKSHTVVAVKDSSFLRYHMTHPLHEFDGTCRDVECTAQVDDSTGSITKTSFTADVSTFDSGNSNRDSHAMEVIDALSFPSVTFASTSITGVMPNLTVQGNLTFHGKSQPVTLKATARNTGKLLEVTGNADVSLTAFGIERPSLMLIPVQDTIRVSFRMDYPIH